MSMTLDNLYVPEIPSDFAQLRRLAIQKIEMVFDEGNRKFGFKIETPKITFDLKSSTAGKGGFDKTGKPIIRLNPYFLFKFPNDFIHLRTCPHEIGHVFTIHKYFHTLGQRVKSHGSEWLAMSIALGLKDITPRHDYPLTVVPKYMKQQMRAEALKRAQVTGIISRNGIKVTELI